MYKETTQYIENKGLIKFDDNWKFTFGPIIGAEKPNFDHSSWQEIDLPHDFSIDQAYSKAGEAQSAYKLGGIGWYRKFFRIDDIKNTFIYFDGIYSDAYIYINGKLIGEHHYGYTSFIIDISPYLYPDRENLLAIRVESHIPNSRWYSGSGIYRSIYVLNYDNVYVEPFTFKVDNSNLRYDKVDLSYRYRLRNTETREIKLKARITVTSKKDKSVIGFDEKIIFIKENSSLDIKESFPIAYPKLWDIDNPNLYEIELKIISGKSTLYEKTIDYGFSYFDKNPDLGFFLNGKATKLKAVCMHHDQGALGACDYKESIYRQLSLLKKMGANAIRITHNPGSRNLIDLCNKMGFLVIEEIFDGWVLPKNNDYNDYSLYFDKKISDDALYMSHENMTWAEYDLKMTIHRDYNDPSIFMYSLGNEILGGTSWIGASDYPRIGDFLIKSLREIDQKRLITIGDNVLRDWDNPIFVDIEDNITANNGLVGINYGEDERIDQMHEDHKDWCLWVSESSSAINSRSVYDITENNETKGFELTSYDESKVGWGSLSSEAWYRVISRDFVIGEAIWTGFDYLGEPTPWNGMIRGDIFGWPAPKSSYFGIIDIAGIPKDRYYFYMSQWSKEDVLHILPSWNKDQVKIMDGKVRVDIYSNAKSVELFFKNTKGEEESLGSKTFEKHTTKAGRSYQTVVGERGHKSLYMTWYLPYEDGTIFAKAYDENGKLIEDTIGRSVVSTTKKPYKLKVELDNKSNGMQAINYFMISILDKDNNLITNKDKEIKVELSDAHTSLRLDNGCPYDMTSFMANKKKAYGGKLLAITKSNNINKLSIKVSADGLIGDEIEIDIPKTTTSKTYKYQKYYNISSNDELNLVDKIYSYKDKKDLKVSWQDKSICEGGLIINGSLENQDIITVYVNFIDDIIDILNINTAILPSEMPKLPKQVPLIRKDGKIIASGLEVTWDDIREDEIEKEGYLSKAYYLKFKDKTYQGKSKIRIRKEDYYPDTYIENLTMEKEINDDFIYYAYDNQQTIGQIEFIGGNKDCYQIYVSEYGTEDKWEKVRDYRIEKRDSWLVYKFEHLLATYVKIVGENLKDEQIKILSLKYISEISPSLEIEKIIINGKDSLYADDIKFDGQIKSIDVVSKDNISFNYIKESGKLILVSEDNKNMRTLTIDKE